MERPDILCRDYLRDDIFRKMEASLDAKAGSTKLLPWQKPKIDEVEIIIVA